MPVRIREPLSWPEFAAKRPAPRGNLLGWRKAPMPVAHPEDRLQLRDRLGLEALHRLADAPAQRGIGVMAEVVLVLLVDRFEQQAQLEVEVRGGAHLAIHTRQSDSSWSMSMGFAM